MAKLNLEKTRQYLQEFNFAELFIEELNWSNPVTKSSQLETYKEIIFTRKPIAELSGAVVFEITMPDGNIPNSKIRTEIANAVQKIKGENLLIFIDNHRSQSLWHWVKIQDKNGSSVRKINRSHFYMKGQAGDSFIPKLAGLFTDLSEFDEDGQISIAKVADKFKQALDVERVTKDFYKKYESIFVDFVKLITGIDNDEDRHWYASVILNRLMFIYFLQKKGFIDNANYNYLTEKLKTPRNLSVAEGFYSIFLQKLFFEGFAKPEDQRDAETKRLIGKIKYLNGGLFLKHKIELKYENISIPDVAFENLFALFDSFSWSLNDTIGQNDNEINPDVLGYIFEKYINQKEFGAYYTRPEITEYLCEQTVNKLILDKLNGEKLSAAVPESLQKKLQTPQYESLSDLYTKLDAPTIKRLIDDKTGILSDLSLLDPACGSGAFLVAAMKTLINVYAAIMGRIEFSGDKSLIDWLKKTHDEHPSLEYYIKKQIITNNLYGVDIMEEATEIAKLRLFLALVASAQTVDDLEPLPNIDFNIMAGNSLMGLMRVDSSRFEKHQVVSNVSASGKVIQKADLFRKAVVQTDMFAESKAKGYQQLINEKEVAIRAYKNANTLNISDLQALRESIQQQRKDAYAILNELLLDEFNALNIRYEEVTWDTKKNKEGKANKRPLTITDIEALEPFHWEYEFSEIFSKKNGFDAIIANPPWEVFQTNEKEFFQKYADKIQKKKLRIEDWEEQKEELMKDEEIQRAWLEYSSHFPHQWLYFKKSNHFKNQISEVNGKQVGNKPNLYCLFLEQSINLLKEHGYCGIVIPSGIYTDLGTKQLRKMLFEETEITGLFCFENRKEIFENVHRSYKFIVLSFEKGGKTVNFPTAFMRQNVEDLTLFPKYGALYPNVEMIKKLSPDSLSIIEFKNEQEVSISHKVSQFPLLAGDISGWNVELYGEEINMTRDSDKFKTDVDTLIVYEGGMVHHFFHQFDEPRYWINERLINQEFTDKKYKRHKANSILTKKQIEEVKKVIINDYEVYRLVIRKIARNTDSRTLITTIVPKKCVLGNSLSVIFPFKHSVESLNELAFSKSDLLVLTSLLNSLTVDFILRTRVTANLNLFFLNQLPIPRIQAGDKFYSEIVERAAKLICTTEEFAELWDEVTGDPWTPTSGATDATERNQLRAELDAMVAFTYGISGEELEYILSTFPLVTDVQKALVVEEFEKIVAEHVALKASNKFVMELINQGESNILEFKSTLRYDLRTLKPEKHIEHSVLKTIAAYLNSEGGTLIIGVEDNKNILGLQPDFDSFSKGDKLDEFQKHFDNLLSKSIGSRFHRYLSVSFPEIEGKQICIIEIKEKSAEPVYIKDDAGNETFYIRRLASTIDLKLSEATKYIQEHWKS
ncbi:ATP-binding protein [Arcicella sp. LKC2W]|uniref:ATP-binding protein n=1 Tax=Arcicella sp. LKC2W TaxID=2984198 RepID=UPI002B20BEBB|nr:ATP-binding protein [Arcicella sp. LKC2W]MEA5460307.1 ATP-binding protein [Arcicella sp. LKC2W]